MLVRIYWSLWGLFVIALGLLFITGNLTMFSGTVLGFIAFGMIFMGMMGVLPTVVGHAAPPKPEKKVAQPASVHAVPETRATAFTTFKSA